MGARKVRLGSVSDVDIRLLRIFQVVVESGGLSAAEVDLGIGRSTISTHLADIETRLGVRLCDRGRKGFALTAEGMKVYQASQSLMRALEDFRQEMAGLDDEMGGELKVGLVDNLVWDKGLDLVGAFRNFSEIGANVDLNVYVLSPDEIEKRLIDGTLSVGLSPVMHRLPSLNYRMVYDEQSYLYCARGHPLFDRPDAQIDDRMVASCSYVRKGYAVSSAFQETNERLNHHVNAYQVESIALLVLTGAHIGFLPEQFARNWVEKGEMRAIRPRDYSAVFELGAMTARNRSPSPAQTAFIDCLIKAVGPQAACA